MRLYKSNLKYSEWDLRLPAYASPQINAPTLAAFRLATEDIENYPAKYAERLARRVWETHGAALTELAKSPNESVRKQAKEAGRKFAVAVSCIGVDDLFTDLAWVIWR